MAESEIDQAKPGCAGRPCAPCRVPWGTPEALLVLVCFMLLQWAISGLLVRTPGDATLGELLGTSVICDVAALAAVGLLLWQWMGRASAWPRAIGLRAPAPGSLVGALKVLGVGAAAWFAAGMALVAFLRAAGIEWEDAKFQEIMRMVGRARSPELLGLAVLVAVVLAPLTEEVLFRGLLYLPLRRRLGVVPAALVVSAAFSAVHAYPWGALHLVVLSLIFVALFERTGSLWVSIAAHGAYNGLMIAVFRTFVSAG